MPELLKKVVVTKCFFTVFCNGEIQKVQLNQSYITKRIRHLQKRIHNSNSSLVSERSLNFDV